MTCDCGGDKSGTTHYAWCRTASSNFERLTCEGFAGPCTESGPTVQRRTCRTAYLVREDGTDPNVDPVLCADCAGWYDQHWDEMWADYNRGRI